MNWKEQTYDMLTKLNRTNALLYKIRSFLRFNPLKAVHFAIFDTHINYANLIRGQKPEFQVKIYYLTEQSSRIINTQPKNSHSGPLFKKSNIPRFEDKTLIGNIIFIIKSINNLLSPIFKNGFIFCSEIHDFDTASWSTDKLFKPSYRTDSYRKKSIIVRAINCLNKPKTC